MHENAAKVDEHRVIGAATGSFVSFPYVSATQGAPPFANLAAIWSAQPPMPVARPRASGSDKAIWKRPWATQVADQDTMQPSTRRHAASTDVKGSPAPPTQSRAHGPDMADSVSMLDVLKVSCRREQGRSRWRALAQARLIDRSYCSIEDCKGLGARIPRRPRIAAVARR